MRIDYKGETIDSFYRADFLVGDVIVELKAKESLSSADEAQVINYLRATGVPIGLLLNFGGRRLTTRRLVNEHKDQVPRVSAVSA